MSLTSERILPLRYLEIGEDEGRRQGAVIGNLRIFDGNAILTPNKPLPLKSVKRHVMRFLSNYPRATYQNNTDGRLSGVLIRGPVNDDEQLKSDAAEILSRVTDFSKEFRPGPFELLEDISQFIATNYLLGRGPTLHKELKYELGYADNERGGLNERGLRRAVGQAEDYGLITKNAPFSPRLPEYEPTLLALRHPPLEQLNMLLKSPDPTAAGLIRTFLRRPSTLESQLTRRTEPDWYFRRLQVQSLVRASFPESADEDRLLFENQLPALLEWRESQRARHRKFLADTGLMIGP